MYRELAPPPALRDRVACLWVRRGAGAETVRVLPDACVDVVWRAGAGAQVAGPDTGPVLVDVAPGTVIAGLRLRPGAGGAALGLPLAEVRDQRVALGHVLPRADAALPGDLDPRDALRALAALAHGVADGPDAAVQAAAVQLAVPGARVGDVAARLGLSDRQLRRRCDAAVGYGPKVLQRVLRLRRLRALAQRSADRDLARLALDAGYADQPHLSNDVKRLTGLTPAQLLG
ncbi:helix-turn-helix domain-containing protein [Conexibacter sp. SYSU D00693]|uniref:AraC family transcriptional regulator n=1 Tax=Conexibacter sp. SYSU D00693 TaxID=2812560 RepID=UPI00196B3AFB|nr:helix-turn-helix domain-containing protein [Conexibacter sp. SYSU D00693]